jgi:protein-S-isoprenylcysteine O-methyltransferase Ste14
MVGNTNGHDVGTEIVAPGAIRRRLLQIIGLVVVQAVILFAAAGTLRWPSAWAYLVLYVGYLAVNATVLLRGHRALVAERSRVGEAAKGWDKRLGVVLSVAALAVLVVAGLDYRWSWAPPVALAVRTVAIALMLIGWGVFTWAMVSNPFFSTIVRIQTDRGHAVATGGPYRFVRHPAYVGYVVSGLSLPLVLGSWCALGPAIVLAAVMFVRTALEDRTLLGELSGYRDYAGRVRYRLLPGVW